VGIVIWIIIGLIAGILAKVLIPGPDPGGILLTTLIGMAGALVGGTILRLFGGTGYTGFNIWSIVVSTLGAVVLLVIFRLITRRVV
jgi:uncharacterized membrane protein YeaQ/YmgE (transglycosylase-associated protein family)